MHVDKCNLILGSVPWHESKWEPRYDYDEQDEWLDAQVMSLISLPKKKKKKAGGTLIGFKRIRRPFDGLTNAYAPSHVVRDIQR